MRTYKLYAMPLNSINVEIANNERFNRITSEYIMIYSDKEKPKEAVEITEEHIDRLTEQEQEWLFTNNKILIAEETKDMASEIVSSMKEKLDELERLLANEDERKLKEDATDE